MGFVSRALVLRELGLVEDQVELSLLDRPLGFQTFDASRSSRQSAHEGGKVVSTKHRPS